MTNVFCLATEKDGKKKATETYTDEAITKAIDMAITLMDKNNDGFITYAEFKSSNEGR